MSEFCECDPKECQGGGVCRWQAMRRAGWIDPAGARQIRAELLELSQKMDVANRKADELKRTRWGGQHGR